jgi:hypothetical protein
MPKKSPDTDAETVVPDEDDLGELDDVAITDVLREPADEDEDKADDEDDGDDELGYIVP